MITGTHCEREENLYSPECSGGLLGDESRNGWRHWWRRGIPNNPQDENEDGKQDCWNDLASNEEVEISSVFGDRNGDGVDEEFHNGIDVEVATGTRLSCTRPNREPSKQPKAPAGRFKCLYNENGEKVEVLNGNFIRINWDDGSQGVYLHMKTVRADLGNGDDVDVGEYLADPTTPANRTAPFGLLGMERPVFLYETGRFERRESFQRPRRGSWGLRSCRRRR